MISIPITFSCKDPGHYPCCVTLRSGIDVRVYHVECIATPEGNEARLQYTSPVHQPVTQEIPIVSRMRRGVYSQGNLF